VVHKTELGGDRDDPGQPVAENQPPQGECRQSVLWHTKAAMLLLGMWFVQLH
jgi:hypothetical protein